jgi:hypothetical protein
LARKERPLEKLQKAFHNVANTEDGLLVLRVIFEQTGYDADVRVFDRQTGDIAPLATNYNLSKRDVWMAIKKLLKPSAIIKIEHYQENDLDG